MQALVKMNLAASMSVFVPTESGKLLVALPDHSVTMCGYYQRCLVGDGGCCRVLEHLDISVKQIPPVLAFTAPGPLSSSNMKRQ